LDIELPKKPEFSGSVMCWMHSGLEDVLVAYTVGIGLSLFFFLVHISRVYSAFNTVSPEAQYTNKI